MAFRLRAIGWPDAAVPDVVTSISLHCVSQPSELSTSQCSTTLLPRSKQSNGSRVQHCHLNGEPGVTQLHMHFSGFCSAPLEAHSADDVLGLCVGSAE